MRVDSISAGVGGVGERRTGVFPLMGGLNAWAIKTELDMS